MVGGVALGTIIYSHPAGAWLFMLGLIAVVLTPRPRDLVVMQENRLTRE
jgi:hypothetical protein